MKNSKIGKIVKCNLEKNLRNNWFIGLNVLLFIISIVTLNFNNVKDLLKNNNIIPEDKKVVIELADQTKEFYEIFVENANKNNVINNLEINIVESIEYDENISNDKVFIEVKESEEKIIQAKIVSKDGIDEKYYSVIENSLEILKDRMFSLKYNLIQDELNVLKESVSIERIMLGVDSTNSDIKQIVKTVVNYLTLIILMLILSKIATDISQEKVTKSIEYVLTSISARDYLIAKVISISLTMVIQLIFTIIYFIISASLNSIIVMSIGTVNFDNNLNFSIDSIAKLIDSQFVLYIGVVFIFLVLTVFLMCIIQATLTSRTTSISEAGNTTTILMTLIFVLYFVSTILITPLKETSVIIYILSCIPIVSMYFIPTMIIIGQANVIQIIISVILLIASIPFSLKICSKIFKNGVLDNFNKKKKEVKVKQENLKEKEINKMMKYDFAKYGYVIGMSIILYIAIQLISTYALSLIINPISNYTGMDTDIISMFVNIFVFIISLLIPGLFVNSYIEENKSSRKINIKELLKIVIISMPIVAIIQIILGYLFEKIGLNYDIVDKVNLYNNKSVFGNILFFIYIAILPAIFEEFYIRKAVLKYSQKYGNIFAIISTSILFAILHMNISQSLFAFLIGVVFAIIAIYSNSILPTCIIHFLNNSYAALSMIFESNKVVFTILNIICFLLIIVGIFFAVIGIVKNRENIKASMYKLKEKSLNKENRMKNNYKYIVLEYTFILACILMIIMFILTQKTIALL